jgi:hypothetical protein
MSIAQHTEPIPVTEDRGSTGSSPALPEDKQITEVIARLRQRFSPDQISSTELERRVRGFHRQFGTARIRTFVAILVERLARRSIETPTSTPTATTGTRQLADPAPRPLVRERMIYPIDAA